MLFRKNIKEDGFRQERLVVEENSTKVGSNGYTRLKDNILFLNADGKHKVLQMESSLSHECKTTVTANLALSLGYTEKKVCLIDLDFRRPRAHRMFGVSKETGLGEYFLGEAEKKDIIKDTGYKNVSIITRGSQVYNPALVLESEKFKNLIKELRNEYDYILLDCAPVLQVSDYIHISSVSDGVLLLVAYGRTTKSQVADTVRELKKNNITILGTVFTMYDKKKGRSYSDYSKYYVYESDYYNATDDGEDGEIRGRK